jgi:hypothetical protein
MRDFACLIPVMIALPDIDDLSFTQFLSHDL